MLRRFSINFAVFSIAMDGIIVLLSLIVTIYLRVWMNRLPFITPMDVPTELSALIYLAFPIIWVGVLSTFSIYDSRKYWRAVDEFSALTIGSFIAAMCQAGLIYLTYREISRAYFVTTIVISLGLCILWRVFARMIFHLRNENPEISRRALIIGTDNASRKLIESLEKNQIDDIYLAGYINLHKEIPSRKHLTADEYSELIINAIKRNRATDLIFSIGKSGLAEIGPIIEKLDSLAINIWLTLDIYDLTFFDTKVENFAGIPMLDLRAPALGEFDRLAKRCFDIFFGIIFLVLSLPFIAISCLLILIDDGWPVFYSQVRIGEKGHTFSVHKLRTMIRDADKIQNEHHTLDVNGNIIYKTRDDPRVTWSGKILRRLSLDELPQFVNVIKGDMSLVGPRPEIPHLVEKYERWQRKRLSVPPGITGWWQVTGRSDKAMHLHTEDDLYYVENYSIWLDIQILIRTIWVVIVGKGSY
jgi:exopolysaccharide biosynthesis polyprenyl glycosylphosphotransferase